MVRVLLKRATHTATGMRSEYNEYDIIEARNYCNQLSDLGYEVCVNFGCGDLITDTEVKLICKHFHDSTIKALYLADTYGGSMREMCHPNCIHFIESWISMIQI